MILRFSEQVIREHMGPESWFDSMLRNAEYSWRSYMVASFDSLMADLSWVPCTCKISLLELIGLRRTSHVN